MLPSNLNQNFKRISLELKVNIIWVFTNIIITVCYSFEIFSLYVFLFIDLQMCELLLWKCHYVKYHVIFSSLVFSLCFELKIIVLLFSFAFLSCFTIYNSNMILCSNIIKWLMCMTNLLFWLKELSLHLNIKKS